MAERKRVLVVDDDVDLSELMRETLEAAGYRVEIARSGQEAMDTLASTPNMCVILLDLGMPGMSGLEFMDHLSQDEQLARIPVVVLSGQKRVAHRKAARVMQKPVEVDELVAAVQGFCG